jgi:CheY-like chemotaxis protein
VDEAAIVATADEGRVPQRVLLVDDNVDAATTLADVLRLVGHRVHVAHDADTALDAAQKPQAEFDVFVLDIGLPGMTGHELVEALKAMPRWQAASFVALTGYGQPSDREDSREAGFDAHLVKPVQEATLLDAIDTLALARARR